MTYVEKIIDNITIKITYNLQVVLTSVQHL